MTSRDFCYWLQGFFEISEVKNKEHYVDHEQVKLIRKHLNMVFYHEIDPSFGDEEHQGKLHALHEGATLDSTCASGNEDSTADHSPTHGILEHTESPTVEADGIIDLPWLSDFNGKGPVRYRC